MAKNTRNWILAVIFKEDIRRLHTRTVETKVRKRKHNRSRGKREWKRELKED